MERKGSGRAWARWAGLALMGWWAMGGSACARAAGGPAPAGPSMPLKVRKAVGAIAKDYGKTVEPVFKAACFNCHSTETRYPWYYRIPVVHALIASDIREARGHLDMTGGFPFKGKGSLESQLKAIAYQVSHGHMPPFDYRLMHPEARLTKGQKKAIEDWTQRGLDSLWNAGE